MLLNELKLWSWTQKHPVRRVSNRRVQEHQSSILRNSLAVMKTVIIQAVWNGNIRHLSDRRHGWGRTWSRCRLGQRLDQVHESVSCSDVHAAVFIRQSSVGQTQRSADRNHQIMLCVSESCSSAQNTPPWCNHFILKTIFGHLNKAEIR